MIQNLKIENFKLYKKIDLPLARLNLLTGINGRGKSTVLQVFLLMSQSVLMNRATNKIYLNGSNVRLGSLDDVKNREISFSEPLCFTFYYETISVMYCLASPNSNATELNIDRIVVHSKDIDVLLEWDGEVYKLFSETHSGLNGVSIFSLFDLFLNNAILQENPHHEILQTIKEKLNISNIHYVSADRIGPQNYYEYKSLGHFVDVGPLGENTVNVLYHKGQDEVNRLLLKGYCDIFGENIDELSSTIEDNTNYWVDKIFQGAKIHVESISGEDLLKLRISADQKGAYFKPTNVGYGFSYSLPIIVAGLIAKPGEILIIENPEAHLHPYAQAILAKFLGLISLTGVQVLVESHSDHILNGFRIAVKDSIVDYEDLNILYFDQREDGYYERINIDKKGGIDNWPNNFFDQSLSDLNYLLGI